mgnify:FL=1
MYKILTMNTISPIYKEILPAEEYEVSPTVENPDAILVRSADLHEFALPQSVKCVARAGAGVNNIPLDAFGEKGVVVFNTPGANSNAVKELVLAGMLLASRDIVGGIAWCQSLKGEEGVAKLVEKGKNKFVGPEIMGKTLGVIGLGEIGALVANAGNSLGMKALGFDPYISVAHAWMLSRSIGRAKSQDDLLAASDYVTVHVPLMDATRGMINEEFLAKMKPGAALLNFARGELADNDAVKAALRSGHLRAYVTDFPNEALLGVKGVIAIPHLGASTPESEDNCVVMACRQIDMYLKNGAIRNSVNYPACDLGAGDGQRVAVLHANVPNMVGQITSAIAHDNINIDNMTNSSKGKFAYTVLHLDDVAPEDVIQSLSKVQGVYGVRVL